MSDLRFNSIAGTVLASGLALMGLREASNLVFHSEPHGEPGYVVALEEAASVGAGAEDAAPARPDFGTLLADAAGLEALVARGEKQFRACQSCHSNEAGGPNQVGPALWGVFGRTAGSHGGFAYSDAMKGYAKPWSYDNLYDYLEAPGKYVPGTIMAFAGIRKSEDRVATVAYLRSLSESPAALPAPLPPPVAAEAPAEPAPADAAAAPAGPEAPAPAEPAPVQPG